MKRFLLAAFAIGVQTFGFSSFAVATPFIPVTTVFAPVQVQSFAVASPVFQSTVVQSFAVAPVFASVAVVRQRVVAVQQVVAVKQGQVVAVNRVVAVFPVARAAAFSVGVAAGLAVRPRVLLR